ncbi:unnamed protein product [Lactuca saligna]|uniref:Uncharacterized protein n=1 Tax=Lactuca saligna TaxID=75948 RepID=A0AA35V3X6_LACSI|nr:unnamed protein product [Lactuca saligna]
MGDLEFVKVHNSAILLEYHPAAHNDLKFIVDSLKKCCLVNTLTSSPVIYQNLIKYFWRSAVVKKDIKGEKSEYSMEINVHQTQDVLEHMGYEGTFPHTIKKLLPHYWKYLAHVFVSCIFCRRSGANEISLANTRAIIALASGIEFNFSKFILHEQVLNLEGNKRDKVLMYPRFLQIIFNALHPELQRENETLSVGPSTFGLMKHKRGGKFVSEGKFPLIKFGIFEESDQSDSEDQSIPTETEDIVFSSSEPEIEEVRDSPITAVAEEHDHLLHKEDETQSVHEEDDEDLYGDVEFLKEIDFTGISDDIPTNTELDLDDEEFGPLPGFASGCFNKVNEVASSATKTGEGDNALKNFLSTSKPMEVPSRQGDVNLEIPPSVSTISTSAPLNSESSQLQTSQSSFERSQSNTSLEVPIVSSAHQVFSTVTTTTIFTPPIQTDEGPSTMFETCSSSSIP